MKAKIRLRTLTLEELREIYDNRMRRDFPPEELKPFRKIQEMYESGHYVGYGACTEEYEKQILAYALFSRLRIREQRHYLFDYFAVKDGLRGSGIGTELLAQLPLYMKDAASVIGEVENPDYAENTATEKLRERRLCFYRRNHVLETGITARVMGMEYRIVEAGGERQHTQSEVRELLEAFYHLFFPDSLYQQEVLIR